MRIGIDFDNTIVCYDALFHRVCLEKGLIPKTVPVNKSDVRNYLRKVGNEDAWTEMQGYVYGARMSEAAVYPGVVEFFSACRKASTPVFIISHKTRHPFLGPQYDLHQSAHAWLEQQGFFQPDNLAVPRQNVFFELTKEAKLERIRQSGVSHFIDDLPEFLALPGFRDGVQRVLFDPNELYADEKKFTRVKTWDEICKLLL
jgi:hypothetical protein